MEDTVFKILTWLVAEILIETGFSVMAAELAYFSIFSPNSLNANNRIAIGPYSDNHRKKSTRGGGGVTGGPRSNRSHNGNLRQLINNLQHVQIPSCSLQKYSFSLYGTTPAKDRMANPGDLY